MQQPGRKPLGPGLVQHLDGSDQAKERLQVILETIAGQQTIAQACDQLGIKEAMFHRLRIGVLEAGLSQLEPRPRGRPAVKQQQSHEDQRLAQLEDTVKHLDAELKTTQVKLEIAQVMPHLLEESRLKKTNQFARGTRKRKRKPRSK